MWHKETKKLKIPKIKYSKELELSDIAGRNVKWYTHFRKV